MAVRRTLRAVRRRARLTDEAGIGMMELVIAMLFFTVAISVLMVSFSSSAVAIKRAGSVSTAGVIADSQMERFRAMTYDWIGLDTSATVDSVYTGDVACVGTGCTNTAPASGASACRTGGTVFAAYPLNCAPTQNVTGPDHIVYRLDTYVRLIQSVASGNPRQTKLVVIVVRGPNNHVFAREESDFDYCTALPDPNGTGASCA
jgi:hypothetical protein